MSLLLDTHALLWWLNGSLRPEVAEQVADPSTYVAVSAVAVWEIEIKRALGKLLAPPGVAAAVIDDGFESLPITLAHAELAGSLPPHHRDPFDRMLVAQCALEGHSLVTRDPIFDAYGTPTLAC